MNLPADHVTASHSRFDMTGWMTAEAKAGFAAGTTTRTFSAGQTIYVQGEPGTEMYRIVTGSVRLSVHGIEGREATFLLLEPGDCFGDSSLVDDDPRPQTAEAMVKSELQVLSRASFQHLLVEHPSFTQAILRLLSRQMRAVSAFYVDSQLSGLHNRVIHRIDDLIRRFGVLSGDGVRLSIRMSQSDLASLVGSSRQSVGKVLQDLQADGLIRIEYGNILVPDPVRFSAAIGTV